MEHTPECEAARHATLPRRHGDGSPNWPLIKDLPREARDAVLSCPHPAHDTPRFLIGQER